MRISQRSYYGMLAMVYLAEQGETRQLSEIAQAQRIPSDFLEKILQQLKKAGLVASKKGSHGGYCLAQSTKKISALDVIQALEGSFTPFLCVSGNHQFAACPHESNCSTRDVWVTLDATINKTLKKIRLADLMKK